MPTEDAAGPRAASPTGPDDPAMTVEQARSLSTEEFSRMFGFESLDAVPLVAAGFMGRARNWPYYAQERPVPKTPKPGNPKRIGYELLVRARPGTGGAAAVGPARYALKGGDADAVRLEVLLLLAREGLLLEPRPGKRGLPGG